MCQILLSRQVREKLKQRIKERGLSQEGPIGSFLVTNPLSLILLSHQASGCLTRKGITFWIESLIINSLKELGFQFSSVTQSRPTLYDSMDCSSPGFLVHHELLELAHTLTLLLLPSVFSSIRVFSIESVPAPGVQSIGVSASASVLLMNNQD